MLEMMPKGRQRVSRSDAVGQTVPEFGSSHRESATADSRQFDWWVVVLYKTIRVSRTKRSSTRQISDVDEWIKVRWRSFMQDFVRNSSSRSNSSSSSSCVVVVVVSGLLTFEFGAL